MAYFAVMREDEQTIEVIHCHLNLWALPLLGSFGYYFDVGLFVEASGIKDVTSIRVAFPFGTLDGGLSDLADCIADQKTARLVFGKNVTVTDDVISPLAGEKWQLMRLSKDKGATVRLADRSGPNYSTWKITLADSIKQKEKAYLRFRVEVFSLGRIWQPTSAGGSVIDLRIADVRESVTMDELDDCEKRIVPIQNLNLFVIAPTSFICRAASPEFYYMRLFEGAVWNKYLRRGRFRNYSEKLVIYQWRRYQHSATELSDDGDIGVYTEILATQPGTGAGQPQLLAPAIVTAGHPLIKQAITINDPFRAFMVVSKEQPGLTFVRLFFLSLAVLLSSILAHLLIADWQTVSLCLKNVLTKVVSSVVSWWVPLTVGPAVLGIWKIIAKIRNALQKARGFVNELLSLYRLFHAIKMWWLKL